MFVRRFLLRSTLAAVFAFSGVAPVSAELLTEEYLDRVHAAFANMYNLDYEESIAAFEALRSDYPNHPGPRLDLAIVIWQQELFRRRDLKVDRFTAPSYFTEPTDEEMPEAKVSAFQTNIDEAQRLSESLLDEDANHPDGIYYLGSVRGIRASFALTIERDKMKALRLGKKAYEDHLRLVEMDPDYIDAYLTLGTYQYVVDNLPWYIKWLAQLLGYRGDEERGLDYLESVAAGGRRSQNVARVLRMVLLVREERFEGALEIARALNDDFPRSYLFDLNEVQILEEMGRTEEAVGVYEEVLQKLDAQQPNYQLAPQPELRLRIAEKLAEHDRTETASEQFQTVLDHADASFSQGAKAHLELGKIHELKNRPDEARVHYRQVLALATKHELSDELRDEAQDRLEDVD